MLRLNLVEKDEQTTRSTRSIETGLAPQMLLLPGTVMTFAELPIGATFRMFAGKWIMRKLSAMTSGRIAVPSLEVAYEFDGDERCVIVTETE